MTKYLNGKKAVTTDCKTPSNFFFLDSTITFSKFSEIFTFIATFLGIYSILGTLMFKYASYGYYLYFEFDMDYFDGSPTFSLSLIFALFLGTGIIAIVLAVLEYIVLKTLANRLKVNEKVDAKIFMIVVAVVIVIIILADLFLLFKLSDWLVPPDNMSRIIYELSSIICVTTFICLCVTLTNINIINILIVSIGLLIGLTFLITGSLVNTEYARAANNKDFAIIIDERQMYAIISQNEDYYSAYESQIDETSGTLYIQVNRHKYFDVHSTPTTIVKFNNVITQASEVISCNEYYIQYKNEFGD